MKGQGEGGEEGSIYDRNSNKGDEKLEKRERQVDERRHRGRRAWYERNNKEGVRQKSR